MTWRLRLAVARWRLRHLTWLVSTGRDIDPFQVDAAERAVKHLEVGAP